MGTVTLAFGAAQTTIAIAVGRVVDVLSPRLRLSSATEGTRVLFRNLEF